MTAPEVARSVRNSYEAQIRMPLLRHRPSRQFFLCPVGLVGAGKTTVAKPLAERLSLVRISNDEVRKLLKEQGEGYESLLSIMQSIAERLAQEGWSIAFDGDCGNPKTKEIIESLAQTRGARICWIHVNPPEAFILKKLRTVRHSWLFADGEAAVANYMQQKERRREEKTRFDFFATIDTSAPDIQAKMAALETRIKAEFVE